MRISDVSSDVFSSDLDMQNTQFSLAQLAAEVSQGRVLVDLGISRFLDGKLSAVDASKIKLMVTELNGRVVDQCLQLFGGSDRKRVGKGKSVAERVDIGGGRIIKKKNINNRKRK